MSNKLRLSVLDQSPVSAGQTPTDALNNSLALAQHTDTLGYTRLWYSEHHAMDLLACTAPEILITRAAAVTKNLRLGSGGIMLPHYSPLKVAEVFRTLHAMFPNRIDLGIGRAPGGGQLEAYALRRDRNTQQKDDFPQQLAELRAFLDPTRWPRHETAQGPHPFSRIHVAPDAPGSPVLWLLGSSMWSSITAAQQGLPYAFAHFFSAHNTREAITHYQRHFTPTPAMPAPYTAIAIGVIVADTQQEADHLHTSVRLLQRRIRRDDRSPVASPEEATAELTAELSATPTAPNPLLPLTAGSLHLSEPDQPETEFPRYIVGTPTKVRDELIRISRELELDELIINTITHSHKARLHSYTLLAEALL